MTKPVELLHAWIASRADESGQAWLATRLAALRDDFTERALQIAFGMAPRRVGKSDLGLDGAALEQAARARAGWDPSQWSLADAARVLLLVEFGAAGGVDFTRRFADFCRNADVAESVALYRGLPLYPNPDQLEAQAGEGLRSNMRTVFEAVAHCNPFPREVFDEDRWNHMVLKALFVDSQLHPIQGLDERANAELARIMCDYAHERWAAGRLVSPELWRCVGPFASGRMVEDLARAYASELPNEARAAALALVACPDPGAAPVLASRPDLERAARSGEYGWGDVAAAMN